MRSRKSWPHWTKHEQSAVVLFLLFCPPFTYTLNPKMCHIKWRFTEVNWSGLKKKKKEEVTWPRAHTPQVQALQPAAQEGRELRLYGRVRETEAASRHAANPVNDFWFRCSPAARQKPAGPPEGQRRISVLLSYIKKKKDSRWSLQKRPQTNHVHVYYVNRNMVTKCFFREQLPADLNEPLNPYKVQLRISCSVNKYESYSSFSFILSPKIFFSD